MFKIIKAEFYYNANLFIPILLIYIAFTISAFLNFNLLDPEKYGFDYWGGIIAGFLYLIYFILYPIRIKENRERRNAILPVTLKQNALSDAVYFGLPAVFTILYFLLFHITVITFWKEQAASVISQLGLFFIIFTSFILIRQIWYSIYHQKNSIKLIWIIGIIIYLLVSIFLLFFFLRQISYDLLGWYYGKLIFYLPTAINLFLSYKFFIKRKSYLS